MVYAVADFLQSTFGCGSFQSILFKRLGIHLSCTDPLPRLPREFTLGNSFRESFISVRRLTGILAGQCSCVRNTHQSSTCYVEIYAIRCELTNRANHIVKTIAGLITVPHQFVHSLFNFFNGLIGYSRHNRLYRSRILVILLKTCRNLTNCQILSSSRKHMQSLLSYLNLRYPSDQLRYGSGHRTRQSVKRETTTRSTQTIQTFLRFAKVQTFFQIFKSFKTCSDASFKLLVVKFHLNNSIINISTHALVTSFQDSSTM